MIDYWLITNLVLFALLLANVFVWVKSLLTLVNAYVAQSCYYTLSPHTDNNIRCSQQATLMLEKFMHIRDKMIFRVMFSTLTLLVIIFVRFVLEVTHADV